MKNIINFFFLFTIIFFVAFTGIYYFSEENRIKISKLRSSYLYILRNNLDKLPILINDTKNIIEYKNSTEKSESNKIKRKFWELIDK